MPSSGLELTDKILTEVGTRVPTHAGDGYRGSLPQAVEKTLQRGVEGSRLLQVDDVSGARPPDQAGSGQGVGQSTGRVERCAIALSDDHEGRHGERPQTRRELLDGRLLRQHSSQRVDEPVRRVLEEALAHEPRGAGI